MWLPQPRAYGLSRPAIPGLAYTLSPMTALPYPVLLICGLFYGETFQTV